jgi:hypothetical protein
MKSKQDITVYPTLADLTVSPTFNPTVSPTFDPTVSPTFDLTVSPTFDLTVSPTDLTVSPTCQRRFGNPLFPKSSLSSPSNPLPTHPYFISIQGKIRERGKGRVRLLRKELGKNKGHRGGTPVKTDVASPAGCRNVLRLCSRPAPACAVVLHSPVQPSCTHPYGGHPLAPIGADKFTQSGRVYHLLILN